MTIAQIELPPKLIPVFSGDRRIRGAYGGRGSGKTFTFALMTAVRAYIAAQNGQKGVILCAREWMNSLKDSSMSEVKTAIESVDWLKNYFDIGQEYIRTKNKNVEYIFTGLNRNLDSLKSKANIIIAWVDEAEGVSETAWNKLEPTVRADNSEIWVTWNPEKKKSPTDSRFRNGLLEGDSLIVEMNYQDNPWFPEVLEQLRLRQQKTLDDATYEWIWNGDYLEHSEAQIFRNKFVVEEFSPGLNWDGPYYGLDFGFSQDPTFGTKNWIHNNILYIEYEASKIGLELDETAPFLIDRLPGIADHVVRADSARPESISYLRRHGIQRCEGVKKGKGSVEDGVEHIKSYDRVVIHPRCVKVAEEFRNYSYKKDRLTGDILTTIEDAWNHGIDSIRYALEPIIRNSVDMGELLQLAMRSNR